MSESGRQKLSAMRVDMEAAKKEAVRAWERDTERQRE
jgi:outer membrane murein-binding lipoprotein Lpp